MVYFGNKISDGGNVWVAIALQIVDFRGKHELGGNALIDFKSLEF